MHATETVSGLGPEEQKAILTTVDDLCRRAVSPLVERPEESVSEQALVQLCASAQRAGVLAHATEPGFGLWEADGEVSLSLAMLRRVSQASPGIAYRFHRTALSSRACRALGLDQAETRVAWEGPAGFGKGALAAALHGEVPEPAMLRDVFPRPGVPLHVHSGPGWNRLAVPVWDEALTWRLFEEPDSASIRTEALHGLQEAPVEVILLSGEGEVISSEDALALVVDLTLRHSLGAIAIALGCVESALARAREYAGIRRQGGAFLHDHAAVRLMLADAAAAVGAVSSMLESPRIATATLSGSLQLGIVAHPLLCAAANQCLQVFGGYGYMRDYGMEKAVRDCNALRLVGGTPTEWKLHVAQEGVSAWR